MQLSLRFVSEVPLCTIHSQFLTTLAALCQSAKRRMEVQMGVYLSAEIQALGNQWLRVV